MISVITLAKHTLREHIRDKFLHGGIVVCFLLLGLSLILGTLTIDEQQRMIFHLGISSVHFLCLALVLLLGSAKIANEIEKQTCLIVLARPISRNQYLLGLFSGLLALTFILILGLGSFLAFLLRFEFHFLNYIQILFSLFLEMAVLLSVTFVAALLFRPFLAALVSLTVYILGVWLPDLHFFAKKSTNAVFLAFVKIIDFITPHFSRLNLRSHKFLIDGIPGTELNWIYVHSIGWLLVTLVTAQLIFRRKDLV